MALYHAGQPGCSYILDCLACNEPTRVSADAPLDEWLHCHKCRLRMRARLMGDAMRGALTLCNADDLSGSLSLSGYHDFGTTT